MRMMSMEEDKPYCDLVSDMVIDEEKAVQDYKKLKAPDNPLIDGIIESIRTDELKHAELLKIIWKDKCMIHREEEKAEEIAKRMSLSYSEY